MIYRNFEQVAIFTLKEEEKGALNDVYIEGTEALNHEVTDLHLVHNGCDDYDAARWILKRVSSPWDGDTMLRFVHMPVYNVVFTTNKDTGGPIKSIG